MAKVQHLILFMVVLFPGCGQGRPQKQIEAPKGHLEVIPINPLGSAAPSPSCEVQACRRLIELIDGAEETIDFAIYGFRNQPSILEALLRAQERGVLVRGIVDKDRVGQSYYEDTDFLIESLGTVESDYEHDRGIASASPSLQAGACPRPVGFEGPLQCLRFDLGDRLLVTAHASSERIDEEGVIMHDKFFIIDGHQVWTGSANISDSGVGGYNANLVVVIDSPQVASAYLEEFEQMYVGQFHQQKRALPPQEFEIGDRVSLTVAFPPGQAIVYEIRERIRRATRSIDLAIFYLTHVDLTQDLIDAHRRGVAIRVIVDATSAKNGYTKHEVLRIAGIPVKVENWGGKMHSKAAVIDGEYVIAGSMNWTSAGSRENDENVLIIRGEQHARVVRRFFDSLWNSIPDTWLNDRPDPEGLTSGTACSDGVDNDFDDLVDGGDPGCSEHPSQLPPLPPYHFERRDAMVRRAITKEQFLRSDETRAYIGSIARVCGRVVDGRAASGRAPTLLNLDRAFLNQPFTVVIWDQSAARFDGPPLQVLRGQERCFLGEISSYRGAPQMSIDGPDQISVR